MVRHAEREPRRPGDAQQRPDAPQRPPAVAGILSLQRSAGNAAVSAILARNGNGQTGAGAGSRPPPKVATGLAAAAPTEAFAQSAVDYARSNPDKSFADLVTVVFDRVTQLLRGIGSHPPALTFTSSGALGLFRRDQWALVINRDGDNGDLRGKKLGELSPGELGNAADTIYHEARHSEQFFRIARMLFGRGRAKADVATETGIPPAVLDLAEAQPLRGEDEQSRQLIKEAEAWHDITVGRFQGYAEGVKDLGRRGSDTLTAAVVLSEAENGESRAERFGAFHLEYLMMKAPIEKIEDDLAQDKVPAPIMIRGQKVLAAYDNLKSLVDDVADDELPLDETVAQDIADCAVALQDAQKEAYKAFAHEVDAFSVGGAASSAVTRGLATTAGAGSQQLAAATS